MWEPKNLDTELLTSTQCSTSIGGFCDPMNVSVRRARNGRSVVLAIANGWEDITTGSRSVDGAGSVRQDIVTLTRKADRWRL